MIVKGVRAKKRKQCIKSAGPVYRPYRRGIIVDSAMTLFLRNQAVTTLLTIVYCVSAVGGGEAAGQEKMAVSPAKPDVLMFVVDDLNDWVSLLDPSSPIRTPNLERLASQGMTFDRAYCVSPACNPSRAATLVGLRPSSTGVYGNRSDWRAAVGERLTLMQQFRHAGYTVRGAGKVFHHHLDGAFHDPESFDDFQPMPRQQYPERKLNGADDYGSRNTDWGKWPPNAEDAIDFHTADYCINALRSAEVDRPMMLVCGIFKPHSPFFAPANFHQPYSKVEPPPRLAEDWDDLPSGAKLLMKKTRWFWTGMRRVDSDSPGAFKSFVRSYAACATFADHQIGRVLDAVDQSPRAKRTVIVLWSDHGFHLGEKDHLEKFGLWEKTTRVPFIVVAPGIATPGSRCETPVDLTTLYPTLLRLCGIDSDSRCDGVSLLPLLRNPKAEWHRPALMTYGKGNHAVRSERWRYIRYADGTEELYDHHSDPNEWTNLARESRWSDVKASHRKWLPKTEADTISDLKQTVGAEGR